MLLNIENSGEQDGEHSLERFVNTSQTDHIFLSTSQKYKERNRNNPFIVQWGIGPTFSMLHVQVWKANILEMKKVCKTYRVFWHNNFYGVVIPYFPFYMLYGRQNYIWVIYNGNPWLSK